MKKTIIVIILLLILLLCLGTVKLFVIGTPVDADTLSIEVQSHDNQGDIYINSLDPALAISNIRYHYEGTVLHMTVWKVLASPLYNDGSKCLYYEITDETEIWLGGQRIWEAK